MQSFCNTCCGDSDLFYCRGGGVVGSCNIDGRVCREDSLGTQLFGDICFELQSHSAWTHCWRVGSLWKELFCPYSLFDKHFTTVLKQSVSLAVVWRFNLFAAPTRRKDSWFFNAQSTMMVISAPAEYSIHIIISAADGIFRQAFFPILAEEPQHYLWWIPHKRKARYPIHKQTAVPKQRSPLTLDFESPWDPQVTNFEGPLQILCIP